MGASVVDPVAVGWGDAGFVGGEDGEIAGEEICGVRRGEQIDIDDGEVSGDGDIFCLFVADDRESLAAELAERFAKRVSGCLWWAVGPEQLDEALAGDRFPPFYD
jgi:hypothetical protein